MTTTTLEKTSYAGTAAHLLFTVLWMALTYAILVGIHWVTPVEQATLLQTNGDLLRLCIYLGVTISIGQYVLLRGLLRYRLRGWWIVSVFMWVIWTVLVVGVDRLIDWRQSPEWSLLVVLMPSSLLLARFTLQREIIQPNVYPVMQMLTWEIFLVILTIMDWQGGYAAFLVASIFPAAVGAFLAQWLFIYADKREEKQKNGESGASETSDDLNPKDAPSSQSPPASQGETFSPS